MAEANTQDLRALVDQVEASHAEITANKTLLVTRADRIFTYEHPASGVKIHFKKLSLPQWIRVRGKLPKSMIVDPGQETKEIQLNEEETSQYQDALIEALTIANQEGLTRDQIGRLTPPDFPEDFLRGAFQFLLAITQLPGQQMENLDFSHQETKASP